ncbi:MAG: AraC family transcriptional regulator [Comamonadaceae bacterium]|nr:MAG: AraC family transcriptional regulator [Comamonadaceae bacterium]
MVLVNALELHSNRPRGRERSVILSLYLSPQWLIEQHPSLLAAGRLFERPTCRVQERTRSLADRLAAEMAQANTVRQERLHFLVAEFVLGVLEQCRPRLDQAAPIGKLNDFRIRRALALMRDRVGSALDIADVASHVGLSRSRFFDLFTACTGLAPKQYLDMLRMDLAIDALARTRQPIAEISLRCGYSAQSHFTRFFVQQIGITPGEYRRAAGSLDTLAAPAAA